MEVVCSKSDSWNVVHYIAPGVNELQPRGQLPVFVNKVLLKHINTAILLCLHVVCTTAFML